VRTDRALLGLALALGGLCVLLLFPFAPGRTPPGLVVTVAAGVAGIVAAVRGRYGISAGMFLIAGAAEGLWAAAGSSLGMYAQVGALLFLFAGLAMMGARADEI
jgi:hypothetical protein